MGNLPFAKSFKDLITYQKAREASKRIFAVSMGFPKEETYSLTDQIRRSSRSVGGQIAEAWAKRRYPNHFTSKLTDADGEQAETQHWLATAYDAQYISLDTHNELCALMEEIGRLLQSMMKRADDFSGHAEHELKETPTPYGTLDDLFAASEH